ncbi:hypothetical protein U3516DRAFT_773770 [Neocallimastix sp. 'constans']
MNIDDYDLKEKKEKIYSNSFEVKIEKKIESNNIKSKIFEKIKNSKIQKIKIDNTQNDNENKNNNVKGNILNFKPLSLNDLINEFQDSSSKLKHLNKILEPLNSNNLLHIKTDNLLYALSNLDLTSDDGTKTELYKTKKIF